jgi:hypothetical protein
MGKLMLTNAQISILCDIAQSMAFAADRLGEVDQLVKEGYIAKAGDFLKLTPKAERALAERGAGLHEA